MFAFPHPGFWASYIAAALFGYLLGSIPFGLIFSWLAGAGDVRKIGSGGTGATNVLRTGKVWAAAATLLLDAAKGAAAVIICLKYNPDMAFFAAIGAFLGHLYPLWAGFKGGKGVATACGILLSVCWPAGLCAFGTWLVVVLIFRISSLGALVAAVSAPIYMVLFHQPLWATLALVLALMVIAAHRANIQRLLSGTEPRIGGTKTA